MGIIAVACQLTETKLCHHQCLAIMIIRHVFATFVGI